MFRTPLLPLFLFAGALAGQQASYVQQGGAWFRQENGRTFRVHPKVITVRTDVTRNVQAILGALQGELAGAQVIRANRLGFRDIEIPRGQDVLDYVARLKATGEFTIVEENTIGSYGGGLPSDPMFASQWNMHNTGQTGGSNDADVDAFEAWDFEDGDPSIVVAVADSGTNWNHEDLVGNIWANPGEVLDGTDSDSNGYVDDIRGWNFDFDTNDPSGTFWHGTSVASVVASRGNSVGLVGLAGGANDGQGVSIMPMNVGSSFPDGSILDDAILYAADNGAHVITMSLSVGTSAAIDAAIDDAHDNNNVFIDCAAGNNGGSVSYPANLPNVMAIASTNHNDLVSSFSNPGSEVEVAAPGEDIPMCDLGNTSYHTNSGTSFSAPHVAGLAALLFSLDDTLTNEEVRQLIIDSADDIGAPGNDNNSGAGRINARSALTELAAGFAKIYGIGTPGASGIPTIDTSAVPAIGTTFDITTTGAAFGASAVLGLGTQLVAIPALGGIINVHPVGMLLFPATISGTGTGARSFSIPNNTAFLGAERFAQWFILDMGAPAGLAMSPGLELRVGLP